MSEVLQRGVQLELASWMHHMLSVLKNEFDFSEEQLVKFSQKFREAMSVKTTSEGPE